MTDYTQYVSLKQIISYFIDENNLLADELDKAWVLSFRALVLLNQQFAAEPKTLRLLVGGNKTVLLPNDYLSWSKIGILNEHGEVSTLKVNTALTTFADRNPNRLSRIAGNIGGEFPSLSFSPYYYNYGTNGTYAHLFGVGNVLQQFGECRVDEKNKVIILPPDFQYANIILEYISSPEKDDDYQIQTVLQEAVIAFLNWKYKLGTRQDFYGACVEARRALPGKKVTLQQVAATIREQFHMSLKS